MIISACSGVTFLPPTNQPIRSARKKKKISAESKKCWRYYQRFHFHSTGIGAMALALLLLLLLSGGPPKYALVSSFFVSIGGFLYPFIWLFAAIYGPEMGRHEAKEAFAIFSYMGGPFLVGIICTIILTVKYPWRGISGKHYQPSA